MTGGVEVEARVALAAARVLGEDQPLGTPEPRGSARVEKNGRGGGAGAARDHDRDPSPRPSASRGRAGSSRGSSATAGRAAISSPSRGRRADGSGEARVVVHRAVAREEELARGRGGAIERGAGRPKRRRGGRLAQRARRRGDPSGDGVRRGPGGRRAAHRGRAGGTRRRECDARGRGGNVRRDPTSSSACQRCAVAVRAGRVRVTRRSMCG